MIPVHSLLVIAAAFVLSSFPDTVWTQSINKDPHFAPGRTGIVHLFEWKFEDIARECEEFLSPFGYAGVQVSPITENIIINDRPWYERYQPLTYKIITRSGNEEQFSDMVRRCNNVGIRIYVDMVINHMAANNSRVVGTGGSTADPGLKNYPDAGYSMHDFHDTCQITTYQNAEIVRNCELEGLHDLNHYKFNVRCQVVSLLNRIISHGVAGFRFDASKHMWPSDLSYIYSQMDNLSTTYFPEGSAPFIFQEVIDQGGEAIKATEYTSFGLVTDFMYSTNIGKTFRGKNPLSQLKTWGPGKKWNLLNDTDGLVFVDNHDNQRGHGAGGADILSHKVPTEYKMAVAFMLAWPLGTPRVMSSYYFSTPAQGPPHLNDADATIESPEFNQDLSCRNGWVCEHRWRQIYNMIAFKNTVEGTAVENWWDNGGKQIAFSRGNKGFIAFNQEDYNMNTRIQTGLPPGYYCDIISGHKYEGSCSGKLLIVGNDGFANVFIDKKDFDSVLAVHENSRLWNPSQSQLKSIHASANQRVNSRQMV